MVGSALYDALHAIKKGLKDVLSPQGMFEDLGLKYVGPVDGHDIEVMESALRRARSFGGPVIVHAVTTKGFGYPPAETDQIDAWHATGVFDPDSGAAHASRPATGRRPSPTSWCGSAPSGPTSSRSPPRCCTRPAWPPFAERFPERTFDVGIAEQHALTSAAGLAMAGLHPVVAVYSTFLNRAFDQLLMDVALHRQPVTVVLDRAGVTGTDGASHNGMWDMSILSVVPGVHGWPRRGTRRRCARRCARRSPSPTGRPSCASRRALPPVDIPALERRGPVDVLRRGDRPDVLLVAVGSMVPMCLAVAERAADHGIEVTVVDPRWVLPVSAELVDLAAGHRLVVTVEDGGRAGGVGTTLTQALQDRECDVPVRAVGPAAGIPRARQPRAGAGRRRADRAGHRPPDRRVDRRSSPSAPSNHVAEPVDGAQRRDRRDPGGAVAAGHGRRPARARRGRDRGDPGVRAALRGRRAGHDARGRRRPRLGDAARRARGDARGRRDRAGSRTSRSPR